MFENPQFGRKIPFPLGLTDADVWRKVPLNREIDLKFDPSCCQVSYKFYSWNREYHSLDMIHQKNLLGAFFKIFPAFTADLRFAWSKLQII